MTLNFCLFILLLTASSSTLRFSLCLAAFHQSGRQADAKDGALMTTAQQGCVAKAPQWTCDQGYRLYASIADQYYRSVEENATSLRGEA